ARPQGGTPRAAAGSGRTRVCRVWPCGPRSSGAAWRIPRQIPAGQGSRLVESADLLFEQRQVMQRVEDKAFALVRAPMTVDTLGPAGDHPLVDIAADHNLAVAVSGRHRVVSAAIAHQR